MSQHKLTPVERTNKWRIENPEKFKIQRENYKQKQAELDKKRCKIGKSLYNKQYYIKNKQKELDRVKQYQISVGLRSDSSNGKTIPEKRIEKFLISNNIDYICEKTFDDCKNVSFLHFDFYLPKLNLIIEFDGPFHTKPIYGEDVLKKVKINDQIKNKYCKDNNINLLRISYLNLKNIEEILSEEIL